MSMNAGETGTLRRQAGLWAARIGRSLDAIVGAILKLVQIILGASGGARPHATVSRMPKVLTRLSRPMVSMPQAMGRHANPWRLKAGRLLSAVSMLCLNLDALVPLGETRYPKDRSVAT